MRIEVNPNSVDDEILGPGPEPVRPPERIKKLTIGRKKAPAPGSAMLPPPPPRPPSSLSGLSGFISAPGPSSSPSSSPYKGPRRYLTFSYNLFLLSKYI